MLQFLHYVLLLVHLCKSNNKFSLFGIPGNKMNLKNSGSSVSKVTGYELNNQVLIPCRGKTFSL